MIHPTYEEMNQLINKAEIAKQYAWDHFDALASRKAVYTLYGARSDFLGAASPESLIKDSHRKLSKQTRRQTYTVYELDADYHVIRVTHVRKDGSVDCTYHVFELDGVFYARPFDGTEKKAYPTSSTEAIKTENGKPVYYSQSYPNRLFCEFYEYPTDDLRRCRQYVYLPHCELTSCRQVPDWNAPYGAPNSPVIFHCIENAPQMLDFSKWFVDC